MDLGTAALAAVGANALTHVHQVVVDGPLERVVLVAAFGILTTSIALLDSPVSAAALELLSVSVLEALVLKRNVRHGILAVSHARLACPGVMGESRVSVVTKTGLAEIDHGHTSVAVLEEVHTSVVRKGSTERVARSLYSIVGVLPGQAVHSGGHSVGNREEIRLEAIVDLAIALGPDLVVIFVKVEVGNPVLDRRRATEHNID